MPGTRCRRTDGLRKRIYLRRATARNSASRWSARCRTQACLRRWRASPRPAHPAWRIAAGCGLSVLVIGALTAAGSRMPDPSRLRECHRWLEAVESAEPEMEDRLTSHWAARCASVLQDLQKVKRDHWPNCPRIANEAEDPSPPDFMQSPEHVIIVHVGSLVRSSCVLHRRTTPAVHDRGRPRPTPSRGCPVPMTNDDRTLLRQAQCPGRRSASGWPRRKHRGSNSHNSWLLTWFSGSVAEAGWTGGSAQAAVVIEMVDDGVEVGQQQVGEVVAEAVAAHDP